MPRHLQAIDLTRRFIKSSNTLCGKRPELREQIYTTLDELLTHPEAPGLHREPIHCAWSQNLKSLRVNESIRILEEEEYRPLRARALYVGDHRIYRNIKNYQGGGADDIVASRQQSDRAPESEPHIHQAMTSDQPTRLNSSYELLQYLGPAAPGEGDHSCIPIDELRKLGLSHSDADRIRRASASVDLTDYISDESVVDAILCLYAEYSSLPVFVSAMLPLGEALGTLLSNPVDSATDEASFADDITPAPIPLASADEVISITAPGQFRRMMEIGLERYLTTLTERQKELAHTDQRGLLVVQGSGGSGKTTVAVHRLRYLADRITMQPELPATGARRVLYLCFNRALADVVRQMLGTLYGGQMPGHIEVFTIHQWSRTYLERRGVLSGPHNASGSSTYRWAYKDVQSEHFFTNKMMKSINEGSAQHHARTTQLSPKFIADEIREVIIGRDIARLDDYLAAEREGRKSRLSRSERSYIWSLYQERLRFLKQSRTLDMAMLPSLALQRLGDDTTFTPYEAVIVDEAQDLTPVGLRLATALAGRKHARMTIFADAAQSIYRSGFRWKQAELNPRGRQLQKLTQNHRNTAQIWAMASSFLERGDGPDEPDAYVTAERPTSTGQPPILLTCANVQTEMREVVTRIQAQIAEGVPPQNIGILSGTNPHLRALAQALREERIATEMQDASTHSRITITHPSVKLLTMHSAKGLDFPHVYLVGLTEDGIPGSPSDAASDDIQRDGLEMQRRLLYTSMIRAGQTLVMTTIAGKEHLLLADVSDELCQHECANMD